MGADRGKILVVDDEENLRHMMRLILSQEGYDVYEAKSGIQALEVILKEKVDLILCDIRMPEMDGLTFLERLSSKGDHPVVIMMSAYGTIETAVSAMKMGAYDYISKPFQPDEVVLTIRKALDHQFLKDENVKLKKQLSKQVKSPEVMVGVSTAMRRLRFLIDRVSRYDSTILITGGSGTGKELVAKEIHSKSPRRGKPFIPINCAALPEGLLESELFGFRRGAFTDARRDKTGLIEEANQGTLFLDEVGELPFSLQAKLLRFLQEGKIRRIGDTTELAIDVRIIAATNQNLKKAVTERRFREDLFFRLNVVQIHVPLLRERQEDIPLLVTHFVQKFALKYKKRINFVDPDVLKRLRAYPWPGNVRELENVIERAVLMSEQGKIRIHDLPEELLRTGEVWGETFELPMTLREARRRLEREMIQKVLELKGGNKKRTAASLGITLRSLQYKIREYQIKI